VWIQLFASCKTYIFLTSCLCNMHTFQLRFTFFWISRIPSKLCHSISSFARGNRRIYMTIDWGSVEDVIVQGGAVWQEDTSAKKLMYTVDSHLKLCSMLIVLKGSQWLPDFFLETFSKPIKVALKSLLSTEICHTLLITEYYRELTLGSKSMWLLNLQIK